MRFLLGGYSADMDGSATGIGLLAAGAADSPLASGPLGFGGDVVAASSPSWLAWHPQREIVYATLEGRGTVRAFERTGDTSFAPLGPEVAVGDGPCHVLAGSEALIVSCWGDGRVVRVALDATGRPGASTAWAAASEADDDDDERVDVSGAIDLGAAARALREAAGPEFAHLIPHADEAPALGPASTGGASRAHQAVALPGGLVATTDAGLDLVRFWRGGRPAQQVALPAGTGPRHMRWHPSGHLYVLTEFSGEIFVLAPDAAGVWHVRGGVSLGALPGDTAAEIALSGDAEYLYVGLRGSDTLATARVRGAGDVLVPVALSDAGVAWPRHHVVERDAIVVAGQRSDDVVSLIIDTRTRVPGRVRHRTVAPSPSMLLALPA